MYRKGCDVIHSVGNWLFGELRCLQFQGSQVSRCVYWLNYFFLNGITVGFLQN